MSDTSIADIYDKLNTMAVALARVEQKLEGVPLCNADCARPKIAELEKLHEVEIGALDKRVKALELINRTVGFAVILAVIAAVLNLLFN